MLKHFTLTFFLILLKSEFVFKKEIFISNYLHFRKKKEKGEKFLTQGN